MAIQSSPMASVTRSTRRANTEGLQQLHPHPPPPHPLRQQAFAAANTNTNTVTRAHAAPQNISSYHHTLSGRTKRQLDDFDHPKAKRSRTSIEILIKPALQPIKPVVAAANSHDLNVTPTPPLNTTTTTTATPQAAPLPKHTPKPAQQHVATVHPPTAADAPATGNAASQLTKHQEKVSNGIKHELDRLQPREADTHTKEGGRKLRSQEASRFKSELSAYFPEYDEVIGNDPKEHHLLNTDTPIIIFDSNPTRPHQVAWHQTLAASAEPGGQKDASAPSSGEQVVPVRGYGDALFDDLVDAQRIDFDFLGISHKREPAEDPLPDASFVPSHKRAERLEKSIRNTERGRAQHEKDLIARLLGGLQGHDWLRVMGVSGITESRKKQFEPARQHFIKGCEAILEKFRQWSLEEKRRKAERDRVLAEKAEAEETSEAEASSDSDSSEGDDAEDEAGSISDGDPPGVSDDDSVTKQLREEASSRSRASKNSRKRPRAAPEPRPSPKPEPLKEFKSFFKKRYERDAALHRHRRAGRKVVAWGHPIPEIPEVDFDLPEEFRDEETLKMQARKRRRDRRGRH
ncbi:hypothetical protein CMUS01_07435 [Colletotrichum musicola]|uniref:Something about silencing protein 4 domain-containing protein n=1 Tax=Colletotrichum musicola TaxID=2175873 RepID=A0A8H6NFS6_9PEZI|nr:hypothetical protein CMUS01_07435 [Colletotrichum musicola]